MTGIPLGSRKVDLQQLAAELAAAGVTVTALGTIGGTVDDSGELITYDAQGVPVDLPPAADAVVAAHTPSTAQRDQLVSRLQSTVGVALVDLTNAQLLVIIGGLLYKQGGLNRQNQVKPLNQWLV